MADALPVDFSSGLPSPVPSGGDAALLLDYLKNKGASIAQGLASTVMAPGNALKSTPDNPVTTEQLIEPAANLAGLAMTGSVGGVPGTAGEMVLGSGPARKLRYAAEPAEVNLGVDAPINKRVQTVADPYRMMYPGIYQNPKEIAAQAAAQVAPEDMAMKRLFGVTRGDLNEMAQGRVGNEAPQGVIPSVRPRGSVAAQNIQTPQNTQRLVDILDEAGKQPGLAHADAWYIMDPAYQRMEKLFGPEEAAARYEHFNTMTGMASPGSDVLTEIQRGTLAHSLEQQGRFSDFFKYGGQGVGPNAKNPRGADFPSDMQYLNSHPYHSTSQALPMQQYLDRGRVLQSENPKVPLYVQASGVPETGFQTSAPVGDAHFSRGVGLADTRKGPTDVGASFSRPEYETLQPWWQKDVAGAVGLESVPAQARLWTALGPQTGVESALGAGKLELLSRQIMVAAKRLGVTPEKARDLILSGKAGAGALAGGAALPLMRQDQSYNALTDHLQ
jgi:hypothetical protein